MSKLFTIALDVDDVLAHFMTEWIRRFGPPARWDTYDLRKMYPRMKNLEQHLLDPALYDSLSPDKEGRQFARKAIRRGHEIIYVTARNKVLEGVTKEWLWRFSFPNSGNCYHFNNGDDKVAALKKLGPQVLLDDRPATIYAALGVIPLPLLWDRPWNSHRTELPRVVSWEHMYNILVTAEAT